MIGKLRLSAIVLLLGICFYGVARPQSQANFIAAARQLVGEPDGTGDLPDSVAKTWMDEFIREVPNYAVVQKETLFVANNNQDTIVLPKDFYREVDVQLHTRGNKKFGLEWIDPESTSYNYLIAQAGLNRYLRIDTIGRPASTFIVAMKKDVIGIAGIWKKAGTKVEALVPVEFATTSLGQKVDFELSRNMLKVINQAGSSYFIFKGQPDPSLTFMATSPTLDSFYCFVWAVYPKYYVSDNRRDTTATTKARVLKLFPPLVSPDTLVRVTYSVILDTVPDGTGMSKSLELMDEPVRNAVLPYMAYKYYQRKQLLQQSEFYLKLYQQAITGWLSSRRMIGAQAPSK